ncbi:MAG TPA: hypothetical protein HA362_04500 [Nanoarchaeota archaeon]|nr:hypothetical protein [Nanoarchaeota archaeon]
MKKRIESDECINRGSLIETGVPDKAMAMEILAVAEHREKFWKEANLAHKYSSLYLEGHYEIIKELCTAILAAEGWKALDHECMFAFIRKKKDFGLDFDYLLELKELRNGIDYRGLMVSKDLWKCNELRIMLAIDALKGYLKQITA